MSIRVYQIWRSQNDGLDGYKWRMNYSNFANYPLVRKGVGRRPVHTIERIIIRWKQLGERDLEILIARIVLYRSQ